MLWKYVGEGSLYSHGVMIVVTLWDGQESDIRSAQRPKQTNNNRPRHGVRQTVRKPC